jgi:hypothetical protein
VVPWFGWTPKKYFVVTVKLNMKLLKLLKSLKIFIIHVQMKKAPEKSTIWRQVLKKDSDVESS